MESKEWLLWSACCLLPGLGLFQDIFSPVAAPAPPRPPPHGPPPNIVRPECLVSLGCCSAQGQAACSNRRHYYGTTTGSLLEPTHWEIGNMSTHTVGGRACSGAAGGSVRGGECCQWMLSGWLPVLLSCVALGRALSLSLSQSWGEFKHYKTWKLETWRMIESIGALVCVWCNDPRCLTGEWEPRARLV